MHHTDADWRKSLMTIAQESYEVYWTKPGANVPQERYEVYWTNPGGNIPENNSCIATNYPYRKPFKLDKEDVRDTAREVRTNS